LAAIQGLKLQIRTCSSRPYILTGYCKSTDIFPRKITNVYLSFAVVGGVGLTAKSDSTHIRLLA